MKSRLLCSQAIMCPITISNSHRQLDNTIPKTPKSTLKQGCQNHPGWMSDMRPICSPNQVRRLPCTPDLPCNTDLLQLPQGCVVQPWSHCGILEPQGSHHCCKAVLLTAAPPGYKLEQAPHAVLQAPHCPWQHQGLDDTAPWAISLIPLPYNMPLVKARDTRALPMPCNGSDREVVNIYSGACSKRTSEEEKSPKECLPIWPKRKITSWSQLNNWYDPEWKSKTSPLTTLIFLRTNRNIRHSPAKDPQLYLWLISQCFIGKCTSPLTLKSVAFMRGKKILSGLYQQLTKPRSMGLSHTCIL